MNSDSFRTEKCSECDCETRWVLRTYCKNSQNKTEETSDMTWTFFGHWDSGTLIIDHAVEGVVEDVYPDDGIYDGGLWSGVGTGQTLEEAEENVRAEYEE